MRRSPLDLFFFVSYPLWQHILLSMQFQTTYVALGPIIKHQKLEHPTRIMVMVGGPVESKTCIPGVPMLPSVHWNPRHIPMSFRKGHSPSGLVAENIYGLPWLSNSLSKFCCWWAVTCMSHPMSLNSREWLAAPKDLWQARRFITL